jgi:hypothetical protein
LPALANDPVKSVKQVPDVLGCGSNYSGPALSPGTNYLYVTPNRYASMPVGVLKITSDGKPILNPRTVPLKGLRFADAQKLWGTPRVDNSVDCKTFGLWGFRAIDKHEKNLYQVDAKFIDNLLISYRVRGVGITDLNWIRVD